MDELIWISVHNAWKAEGNFQSAEFFDLFLGNWLLMLFLQKLTTDSPP